MTKFKELEKQNNIIFLGEIKHKQVPTYLKKFHIGILPYKVNSFTKSINPLKIYEYVASGLPVISTNLPNVSKLIKDYPKIEILKAENDDNFIKQISYIKKLQTKFKQDLSIFLKENAWKKRFQYLEK